MGVSNEGGRWEMGERWLVGWFGLMGIYFRER